MYQETHSRSVLKAVSWRVAGSLTTSVIAFIFLRRWDLALAAGSLDFLLKVAIYYLHERAWDRIPFGKRQIRPSVVWLTGLSGAGKTTLAQAILAELARRGIRAEHLDGDTIRQLFPSTGFTPAEREEHVRRVGYLASRLERNGLFVVVSLISPSQSARDFARSLCGSFVEVHLDTPLEVCESRDPKGLYRRARAGEIRDFTGISAPYEAPEQPEVRVDTSRLGVEDCARLVLDHLRKRA
jgi:adenylylsulfate kinase